MLGRATLERQAAGGLGLVWATVTRADRAPAALPLDAVEPVIDVLRRTNEAEVAVVLKESDEGAWLVSARSKGLLDVGRACTALGGGGHAQAAGFTAHGSAGGRDRRAAGAARRVSGQRALKGAGAAGGAPSGLVIVDKPSGLTSHDVVARIRRLAGTRRVGHAGTLDPMATGVLVIGVEQATRMLGHLALTQKQYRGTIRLGQATDTDDAEGQITARASAAGVTPRGAARRDRRADRRDPAGPAGDQRDQGRRPARLPADPRGRAARAGRPAGHGQRAGHPRHPPEHRPGGGGAAGRGRRRDLLQRHLHPGHRP